MTTILIIAVSILGLIAIVVWGEWLFEQTFRQAVQVGKARTRELTHKLITRQDLKHLPLPVQRYIHITGSIDKPRIDHAKIMMEGAMRSKNQDWFSFTSEQYNFFDLPTRLFFMKAKINGVPVHGYHAYQNANAHMLIKLLSLIPLVNLEGKEMDQAETVTVFNDMCLFAPSSLTDKRISWGTFDDQHAQATFTNQGIRISATLYFDKAGRLVNFVSDDRYALEGKEMRAYRFSTPIRDYQSMGGYNLCAYGEAVWHYPEGEFVYGKFRVKEIAYNAE